jgi:hypothetical protein
MSDNDPVDGPEYCFYEWLSGFGFLQRALAQMECDTAAVECGAVEMFRAFLQKQWAWKGDRDKNLPEPC